MVLCTRPPQHFGETTHRLHEGLDPTPAVSREQQTRERADRTRQDRPQARIAGLQTCLFDGYPSGAILVDKAQQDDGIGTISPFI